MLQGIMCRSFLNFMRSWISYRYDKSKILLLSICIGVLSFLKSYCCLFIGIFLVLFLFSFIKACFNFILFHEITHVLNFFCLCISVYIAFSSYSVKHWKEAETNPRCKLNSDITLNNRSESVCALAQFFF